MTRTYGYNINNIDSDLKVFLFCLANVTNEVYYITSFGHSHLRATIK